MKNGICPACGKKANRSKTFEATINPFNRTEDRSRPKTREEVAHDLREMAAEWRGMPTYHARCEP